MELYSLGEEMQCYLQICEEMFKNTLSCSVCKKVLLLLRIAPGQLHSAYGITPLHVATRCMASN